MTGEKLFLKNRGSFHILVLIFAVSGLFTTCAADQTGDGAPVTDLWEQLRNTAWTMTWTDDSDSTYFLYREDYRDDIDWQSQVIGFYKENPTYTYTIGFYGPKNGPYARPESEQDQSWYVPYFVIRVEVERERHIYERQNNPSERYPTVGSYLYSEDRSYSYFSYDPRRLQIDRYGTQISFDDIYGHHEFPSRFNISVSGEKLTITNGQNYSEYTRAWYDVDEYNSTWEKISSDYNWRQ